MIWAGIPASAKASAGGPGTLIDEALVATGDGAYRIERCEFPDDPSIRPLLRKGTKLGE